MQRARTIRFLHVACAFALALVMAGDALAQDWVGRGRMRGKVTGPDGSPLEGVKVTLMNNGVEGEGPKAFFTDKKGRWSYLGLAGGNWTLRLEYEGMLTAEASIRVSEFGAGPNLDKQLKPIPVDTEQEAADERRNLIDEGNTLLEEGNYSEARAAYEQVLPEIDESQHPALLRGIARTHYEENNVDEAIGALDRALAIVPDDADTLRLAINLLVASGREDDAKSYMDRLPEGAAVDANAVLNLGIQKYNENDYAGAVEYFDRAARDNPDMPEVYYFRGLTHLGLGNNEEAKADFTKMLEIAPGHEKAEVARQFVEYLESQTGG